MEAVRALSSGTRRRGLLDRDPSTGIPRQRSFDGDPPRGPSRSGAPGRGRPRARFRTRKALAIHGAQHGRERISVAATGPGPSSLGLDGRVDPRLGPGGLLGFGVKPVPRRPRCPLRRGLPGNPRRRAPTPEPNPGSGTSTRAAYPWPGRAPCRGGTRPPHRLPRRARP